jgi:hypothetical protein
MIRLCLSGVGDSMFIIGVVRLRQFVDGKCKWFGVANVVKLSFQRNGEETEEAT